jgi:pilus assembly protein CpaC
MAKFKSISILSSAAIALAMLGALTSAMADDVVIRPSGPPLVISRAGTGVLIQASVPLGNVFVADPAVADVQIPTQGGRNLIYVFGKKAGRTSLYALGDDGQVALSRVVDVSGPKTVRVLHGQRVEIWSEAHGEPTGSGANLADLPAGSTVSVPVGGQR